MTLGSALANISPPQGWNQHTGEFGTEFIKLVFGGQYDDAYDIATAKEEIWLECQRIYQVFDWNQEQLVPNDCDLFPRSLYLEAVRLVLEAIRLLGPDFVAKDPPPEPKGELPTLVCERLLAWARKLKTYAEEYRRRNPVC